MENYIKTIINGLKAWVGNCIAIQEKKTGDELDTKVGAVYDELDTKVGAVYDELDTKADKEIPVVELIGISDIGGHPVSTAITVDVEAPVIIFHAENGETVVGTRVERGRYLGFSSRGRPVYIDAISNDMTYTMGLYGHDSPNFPLTVEQIWDNLTKRPSYPSAYALSANQGFELQKQITALTARVEALEQGATT